MKEEKQKKEKKQQQEVERLKRELTECEKQKEEYLRGWQRARADLINYKREEMERWQKTLAYALEPLFLKIIAILDNFEIAEKNISSDLKDNEVIKGFLQIKKQIEDFLKKEGIEVIVRTGEKFNPHLEEAIEEIEKEGIEKGIVLEVVEKGYKIKGRLLRPAKVKISK